MACARRRFCSRPHDVLDAWSAVADQVTEDWESDQLVSPLVSEPRLRIVHAGLALVLACTVWNAFGTSAAQASEIETSPTFESDGFEISTSTVTFPEPSGDRDAARQRATVVELVDQPEMIIIDTEGAVATFLFRSLNNGTWSEWLEVETPLEEAPDGYFAADEGGGRASAIGPIWIGDGAEQIELALFGGSIDSVTVEALRDVLPEDPAVAEADLRTPGFSTAAPKPSIRARSSWATDGWQSGNNGCDGGPFYANNVRTVVVHHTVTSNSYSESQVDDILRGIYRTHAVINGWCDIAYNFLVDRFGTIWEGRTGGIDEPVIGGHAKGFNTWTAGVAVLGSHHTGGAPTAASVAAVEAVARWKLSFHGVDPLGVNWLQNRSSSPPHRFPEQAWVEMPAIVGHRDLGLTACPGNFLYPSIPGMREAAAADHIAASPHVPVGRNPAEFGPALLTLESAGGLRSAGAAFSRAVDPLPTGVVGVAVAGRNNRGQLLDSSGALTAFGGAAQISGEPAGSRTPVDLAMGTDEGRGWVLTNNGRIYRFGGAPDRSANSRPADGTTVAFALDETGAGYVLGATGSLHRVGGATERSLGATVDAVDIALFDEDNSSGIGGGWVLDRSGRLHAFGNAPAWQPESAVGTAVAVVAQGEYGGWVLDSEGRYVRFGEERRIQPISTTVGSPTAIDAAIVGWDASLEADDMRYAAALRELFLGTSGDPRAIDLLAHRAVEIGSATVVAELAASPEWAGVVITQMYIDVLGRAPDPSGLQFWLDRLSDGARTQDIGAQFYSSPEYVEEAGSTNAWLGQLYRALLEREPDPSGIQYWRDQMDGGMSPFEVTAQFYSSPESRNGRVEALYQRILGRAPEAGGQEFWANQLYQIDDIRLAVELATSGEYYDRVTE